jgi:branched-chain amino acid transport system permease protein
VARPSLRLPGPHGRRSRRGDVIGISVLAVLLVAFPFVASPTLTNVGVYALIYSLAALGLSLLMGLAGQVSLGQAGFFAIGAYTQAVLVTRYEVGGLVASVAAVAVTMAVALLVGLPLLRLRGHYLALATLLVPFVLLGLLLARNVVESRIGRALGAVNDSEVAAESLGVDTFRLRVQVFVLSAAFASVAGTAFAHWLGVINPNAANFPLSVSFLLMAVLGGVGSVYGAVIGAFAVEGLDDGLRRLIPELVPGAVGEVQLIGFGILLTVIMIFLPGGLYQLWTMARRRLSDSALDGGGAPAAGGTAPAPDTGPLLAREGRPAPGTPLLEVTGLTKRFGGVTAVDGLDLTVYAGEIVALIGPNGAGKTTAFNMISGAVVPSAGTVTMAGARVDGRKPHVFARAGATRTFQNLQIFTSATVLGNVMVGRHLRSRTGLLGAALVLPARGEERALEASARELLDLLGLGPDADRLAVDLPFGRQRLVEVARALALEPDLLLLDEPMAGLSGAERRDLARLLRRLRSGGMAIVLVEHDVEAVLALADRVVVLEDGVRIALGTPEEVRHDPAVVAAYLGVEPEDSAAVAVAEAGPGGSS